MQLNVFIFSESFFIKFFYEYADVLKKDISSYENAEQSLLIEKSKSGLAHVNPINPTINFNAIRKILALFVLFFVCF